MSIDMNYVNSFNLFGKYVKQISCITGEGAPSTSTIGAVGMLYMDIKSDNKDLYKCTSISENVYVWKKLIEVDNLYCKLNQDQAIALYNLISLSSFTKTDISAEMNAFMNAFNINTEES